MYIHIDTARAPMIHTIVQKTYQVFFWNTMINNVDKNRFQKEIITVTARFLILVLFAYYKRYQDQYPGINIGWSIQGKLWEN